MKQINNHKAAVYIIAAFAALITLASCYNERVAVKQVDKAILEHPNAAAHELRKAFPCIESPIVHIVDSADYKLWRDSVLAINAFYEELLKNIIPDTVINNVVVSDSERVTQLMNNIEGFRKVILAKSEQIKKLNIAISDFKPIHDTVKVFVKDSAAEAIILAQKDEISTLRTSDAKNKGKSDKWFWIAMAELVLIAVGVYLKVRGVFVKA